MLHFIVLFRYCLFFLRKLKVYGNASWSKSFGTIFPTSFAYFISLCHTLVILTIFQTFSLLLYLLSWSVIFYNAIVIVCHFIIFDCYAHCLFRHNSITYLIDYSVNMTFICTGKPKIPDLLYGNICFITVVCNWAHTISDVHLYIIISILSNGQCLNSHSLGSGYSWPIILFLNPVYLVPVLSFTIYAILDRLHNLTSLIFSSVNQGDASTFQHHCED